MSHRGGLCFSLEVIFLIIQYLIINIKLKIIVSLPSQKEKSMTDSEMKLYQSEEDGKLIVYQTENKKDIEVYVAENTIWLTQSQIADLFVTTPQNVTIHIRNIFKDRELEKASTCKDFLQVQQEGNRQVSRVRQFYNLDIILSVGYRVKSVAATRFRIWGRSCSHSPGWIFRRRCWCHNITQPF